MFMLKQLDHPAKVSDILQSVCDNLNMTRRLVVLNVQALAEIQRLL